MGDLGRVEQARSHLVQKRLEEVVVVPVEDEHVGVRPAQRTRRAQAPEAGADDDHARPRHSVTLQQRSYSRAAMVPASAPPMPSRDGLPPCRARRVRTVSTPTPAARTLIPPTMSRYNQAP